MRHTTSNPASLPPGLPPQCTHTYITSRIHHSGRNEQKNMLPTNWRVMRWPNGPLAAPRALNEPELFVLPAYCPAVRGPLGCLAGCRCLHPDGRSCMLLRRVRPADSPSYSYMFALLLCYSSAPLLSATLLLIRAASRDGSPVQYGGKQRKQKAKNGQSLQAKGQESKNEAQKEKKSVKD